MTYVKESSRSRCVCVCACLCAHVFACVCLCVCSCTCKCTWLCCAFFQHFLSINASSPTFVLFQIIVVPFYSITVKAKFLNKEDGIALTSLRVSLLCPVSVRLVKINLILKGKATFVAYFHVLLIASHTFPYLTLPSRASITSQSRAHMDNNPFSVVGDSKAEWSVEIIRKI